MEFTAAMIAQILNGTVEGDPETRLNTVARIEEGRAGALLRCCGDHQWSHRPA